MTARQCEALAFAVAVGAAVAIEVRLEMAVVLAVVAFARRWPWCLVIAGLLGASSLSAAAWAGLDPGPTGPFEGSVTLVDDPETDEWGVTHAVARVDGRHVEIVARTPGASRLAARLAGERLAVRGTLRPLRDRPDWLSRRHIAGRMDVAAVGEWRPGPRYSRLANGYLRTLRAGVETMDARRSSLLLGLAVGDDRDQPPELVDAFRASGLSHLLAVSGQNVMFVTMIVAPILRRLRLAPRTIVALMVVGLFAFTTRFEPSVLRASAMAGGSVVAHHLGREADSRRLLALAVVAVLLVDPLLVGAAGFQLSVAAAAGIIRWAASIEARLPGPRWLAQPLGVTLAAQAAVAPVSTAVFGGLPVASVPANLLAGPAAGPAMVWTMTAGGLAGHVGGGGAELLHLPSRLLVDWIALVAETVARLPLGHITTAHVIVGAAGLLAARRLAPSPSGRGFLFVVVSAVVAHAALFGSPRRAEIVTVQQVGRGDGRVTIVTLPEQAGAVAVLEDLRLARVGSIDVLVAERGNRADGRLARVIARRHAIRLTLAPPHHQVPDGQIFVAGTTIDLGDARLTAVEDQPRLVIAITARPPP